MIYEFIVSSKEWPNKTSFDSFLVQGANPKLSEIFVKGRRGLLYKFFYGTEYNIKGTAPLHSFLEDTQKRLLLSPGTKRIPRYKYKLLQASSLYSYYYYMMLVTL